MRKGAALAIGGAALALLLLASSDASAIVNPSKGPQVAKVSSYEGDAKRWTQARYDAARDYLERYWGSALSEDGLHDAAISVVAHWALETGTGVAEWNWNFGNVNAVGSQSWYLGDDINPKTGRPIKVARAAYPSLAAGVAAYFKLLEDGYPSCMTKLTTSPSSADWIQCLGERGYYAKTIKGKDNIGPAAAAWAARRAVVAKAVE